MTVKELDVFDPWNLDEILDENDEQLLSLALSKDSEQKDQQ